MPATFTPAGNLVHPSPEDWHRAEAFVDGPLTERTSAEWVAKARDEHIRSVAVAEMQARQGREFRKSRPGNPLPLTHPTEPAGAVFRLNH